ncbi:hypothetical protein SynMEDNS5_02214 [Synechococcus sp. MEDNS5]|nr:hypothetical protein SynMEDNS5_02214 [Synechococcus sp. MEDNS5]
MNSRNQRRRIITSQQLSAIKACRYPQKDPRRSRGLEIDQSRLRSTQLMRADQ